MNFIEQPEVNQPETIGVDELPDGSVAQIRSDAGIVYRIQARVLPHLSGSIYLASLGADEGWAMIDSGSGTDCSNADLERGFNLVRSNFDPTFSVDKIRYIILTHAHIDHFGGAYEWKRRSGAEIWVHAFESRLVAYYDACARVENMRYEHWLRESGVAAENVNYVLDGFGFRPGRAKGVAVDRKLYGGETFGPFKFVYLPGHSSGHTAVLFGNLAFTGDLLLSKTITQIWPTRMTPQTGMVNYITSLKRLERIALAFEGRNGKKLIAAPAHEDAIFDIPARIGQALRGTEKRNQRVLKLLRESETPATLEEITRRMYWSGNTNREFFALSDVGARVELLLQLGLLEIVDSERLSVDAPTIYYRGLLPDAETTKNTVEQVVGMYLAGNDSDTI